MNIPIETVVELLIANRSWDRDAHHVIWDTKGAILTHAETVDELRTEVKAHIQTLVPVPKLLSECEESSSSFVVGWRDVVTGKEGRLSKVYDNVDECNAFCDKANGHLHQTEYFSVAIQPVEVK